MTNVTNLQRIVAAVVEEKTEQPFDDWLKSRVAAGDSPERIAESVNEIIGVPGSKGVTGRTLRRWVQRLSSSEGAA